MKNEVELLGTYGDDLTHAQSAWSSTFRALTEEKLKRAPTLLKYLAENEHHTPFEKSSLHFLVTGEIASHIHCLKHRIGVSINAESARYKELNQDKYFIPDDWPEKNKQELTDFCLLAFEKYHSSIAELTPILGRKRAKESSRFYLPYSNQIIFDIMFNFRSFMHFQKLRNDEHAQKEIREISQTMLELVKNTNKFKHSLEAFGY